MHWNVLCRWALCRSLAEPAPPPAIKLALDSNVEMTWRVFAGDLGDTLWALVRYRCHQDGLPLDEETLAQQFRLHLHRGIGYLVGDTRVTDIAGLARLALAELTGTMTTPVARHRTAMSRTALSRPLATAVTDQLLTPGMSVFDYGCGRGDDLRNLCTPRLQRRRLGSEPPARWRAPGSRRRQPRLCRQRHRGPRRARTGSASQPGPWPASCSSSRPGSYWDARDLAGRPLGDGLITRTGTFQKFYEQAELSAWIEQALGIQPLAAAPGIFYVFRDPRPGAGVPGQPGLQLPSPGHDRPPCRLRSTPRAACAAPRLRYRPTHARPGPAS